MANFNFQIVSPPFSCGVARMINMLLELNIKTTNTVFGGCHWIDLNNGMIELSNVAQDHLKWHLPIFHKTNFFKFTEETEVIWEHRLSFAQNDYPTILFVRDPRDAIYSLYRRNYEQSLPFLDYLKRNDIWPDHFPGLFGLPPGDTYALFCFFWLAMSKFQNLLIVRFEDLDANPHAVIEDVLKFIGIYRDQDSVGRAIESSTFQKAQDAMVSCESITGKQFKTARSAKINEWKHVYKQEELSALGALNDYLIEKFGYESQVDVTRCDGIFKQVVKNEWYGEQLRKIIFSKQETTRSEPDVVNQVDPICGLMDTSASWAIAIFNNDLKFLPKMLETAQIFLALLCINYDLNGKR